MSSQTDVIEKGFDVGFDYAAEKLQAIQSYAALCAGEGDPSHPLEVFLEVSNICDLKCAMCWQFSALNSNRLLQLHTQDRGFLDTGKVANNIEGALRGALLVHCFGFGEPTLHPSFKGIVDQIFRHGCMVDFYTNGMHLDQEMCEFLVDRGVCQIVVSFSGATKEIYENIYMGGNFEQVLGGIKRLADTKKAKNSAYPVIHVNSIGFDDHVERFDEFVELVAAHGADVVFLRKLDVHPHMPELFEHVSIMRVGHEQKIIERAQVLADRLGVRLDLDLYARHEALDEVDFILKQDEMRSAVGVLLSDQKRPYGSNPISEFQKIAKSLPMTRVEKGVKRPEQPVLALASSRAEARTALQIQTPDWDMGEHPFQCMEPFKTLYVTRNGPTKPCCFADPKLFLGDARKDDAVDVWQGQGFQSVRQGIASGEYPSFCTGCLKNKSAPGHFANSLVGMYLIWHEAMFGPGLRATLDAESPDARAIINGADTDSIMAGLRKRMAVTEPA